MENIALNAIIGGVAAFLAVKAFDAFNSRLDEAVKVIHENTVAIAELKTEVKFLASSFHDTKDNQD